MQLRSVALQLAKQTQLQHGWVSAAHPRGARALRRGRRPGDVVKHIWLHTTGCRQSPVWSKVSLVLIISAALFYLQPLIIILFCAAVLCKLTNGSLPEECVLVLLGGCMQEVMGASLAQLPCEVSCY